MEYSVRVLSVGESLIAGPEVFWMSRWDEMYPLGFNVTLIRGGGITALVNASPPDETTMVEEGWPSMRYLHDAPKGDLKRQPEHYMTGALETVGLTPDDITHNPAHSLGVVYDRNPPPVQDRAGMHRQAGLDSLPHHT